MSFNWGGIAAAYQGARDEQQREADEARRVKADARADQDAAFQEEARNRQRTDWKEADRIRDADKADRAAVNADYDQQAAQASQDTRAQDVVDAQQQVAADKQQAAIDATLAPPTDTLPGPATAALLAPPASVVKKPDAVTWNAAPAAADTTGSPKLDPAVTAKVQEMQAAGIPATRDFNDTLDRQLAFLRRKNARGDIKPEEYAAAVGSLERMKQEGVTDALNLMSQGRYDDAMKRYNSVGAMRGSSIVSAQEGTTKINGEDVPTHYVTVRNPDGSRTQMDVAKAQYQLLDMNTQLAHVDRARQTQMQRDHFAASIELQKKELDQRAKDAAAQRALLSRQIAIAEQNTPIGQIQAKEKFLGRPLTLEEKQQMLGIDTMPVQIRAQLNSLLKEGEGISSAMNKAQAEGMWDANSTGAKQLVTRQGVLNQQISDLLSKVRPAGGSTPGADPAGILGPTNGAGKQTPTSSAGAAGVGGAVQPGATVSNPFTAPGGVSAPGGAPQASAIAAPAGVRAAGSNTARSPELQQTIAKALGLTGDDSTNRIVMNQAADIANAATDLRARRDVYLATAKSSDPVAIAEALKNFNTASAAYNAALQRAGNMADAARNAADSFMQ